MNIFVITQQNNFREKQFEKMQFYSFLRWLVQYNYRNNQNGGFLYHWQVIPMNVLVLENYFKNYLTFLKKLQIIAFEKRILKKYVEYISRKHKTA